MKYKALLFWIALIIALEIVGHYLPHDSTDPPNSRSGLGIYTDHLTGCQYLASGFGFGGLTPRMDANGKQVCEIR